MYLTASGAYARTRIARLGAMVALAAVATLPLGVTWVAAILGLGGFVCAWTWWRRAAYALRTDARGVHVSGPYLRRSIAWEYVQDVVAEDGMVVRIVDPKGGSACIPAVYGTDAHTLAAQLRAARPGG